MSLADEVLATHVAKPWPNAKDWCAGCGSKVDWPCESVRLALSLQAAENVVEAARQARICFNGHDRREGHYWGFGVLQIGRRHLLAAIRNSEHPRIQVWLGFVRVYGREAQGA